MIQSHEGLGIKINNEIRTWSEAEVYSILGACDLRDAIAFWRLAPSMSVVSKPVSS